MDAASHALSPYIQTAAPCYASRSHRSITEAELRVWGRMLELSSTPDEFVKRVMAADKYAERERGVVLP